MNYIIYIIIDNNIYNRKLNKYIQFNKGVDLLTVAIKQLKTEY